MLVLVLVLVFGHLGEHDLLRVRTAAEKYCCWPASTALSVAYIGTPNELRVAGKDGLSRRSRLSALASGWLVEPRSLGGSSVAMKKWAISGDLDPLPPSK